MKTQKTINHLDNLYYALAYTITIYMAISTFTFLQTSSEHYSTLMLGIVGLSSLRALSSVLREGQTNRNFRFWFRLIIVTIMLISTVVSMSYIRINATRLEIEQPYLNNLDVVMGFLFIIAILLANWFFWGAVLTSVILVALLYFFFGHLIGFEILSHQKYTLPFLMSYIGMNTTAGAFTFIPDGVEKLYFLVIFSSVMIGSGMINLVMEIGKTLGRYIFGGAAFPAIVGSTLVGTVTGAAVTNVAICGPLTIPIMTRYGFTKEFAGGVEAAASTAGQIIPPVMGLAAFIMAAMLDIPYIKVIMAAIIPAFLYITAISFAVIFKAKHEKMTKLKEPINVNTILRLLPSFIIPFTIVLILLLMFYSPALSGLIGIVAVLLICPFQGPFRPSLRQLIDALKDGMNSVIPLCLVMITVGPLAQAFITTNIAGNLSDYLSTILPNIKLILLLGAMILCLILGMGLPTGIAYIICVLTLGHFIIGAGVSDFSAHFFIMYFAVFSALTPPVALASMAASRVSGGSFVVTSKEALILVLPVYFVPFALIYQPELLAFPNLTFSVLIPLAIIIAIQVAWCAMFYGYFIGDINILGRALFGLILFVGCMYIVSSKIILIYIMVALFLGIILWRIVKRYKGVET